MLSPSATLTSEMLVPYNTRRQQNSEELSSNPSLRNSVCLHMRDFTWKIISFMAWNGRVLSGLSAF